MDTVETPPTDVGGSIQEIVLAIESIQSNLRNDLQREIVAIRTEMKSDSSKIGTQMATLLDRLDWCSQHSPAAKQEGQLALPCDLLSNRVEAAMGGRADQVQMILNHLRKLEGSVSSADKWREEATKQLSNAATFLGRIEMQPW